MDAIFEREKRKCGKCIDLRSRNQSVRGGTFDEPFFLVGKFIAVITTVSGKNEFNGINIAEQATHQFKIDWSESIERNAAQYWISWQGREYSILDATNCHARNEVLILRATERGLKNKNAARV